MAEAAELARQRLRQQGITDRRFAVAADVVRWFGVMQAQDWC